MLAASSASSASTDSATLQGAALDAGAEERARPRHRRWRGDARKEHEADHVGARMERDIERFAASAGRKS